MEKELNKYLIPDLTNIIKEYSKEEEYLKSIKSLFCLTNYLKQRKYWRVGDEYILDEKFIDKILIKGKLCKKNAIACVCEYNIEYKKYMRLTFCKKCTCMCFMRYEGFHIIKYKFLTHMEAEIKAGYKCGCNECYEMYNKSNNIWLKRLYQ